ncbi:hypothetical protein EXN66_Car020375 [Channa argus]|uniref:Uncharacterized protein n=1 Tax=Channa argus TaxID=215402 RepID=A0A6G1QQ58_CHAAH|nr:hypothetical protein EXN66_Car020375 [Channa argus]
MMQWTMCFYDLSLMEIRGIEGFAEGPLMLVNMRSWFNIFIFQLFYVIMSYTFVKNAQ